MVDMDANTLLSCNKLDCARSLRVLQRAPSNNPLRDVSVLTTYRQPDIGRFGPCLTLGDHCQYMCVPFGGQLVGANGKPYRYAPEKNATSVRHALVLVAACRCACPVGQLPSSDALACVEGSPPVRTNESLVPPVERFPPTSPPTSPAAAAAATATGKSAGERDQLAAAAAAGSARAVNANADEMAMTPRTAAFLLVALLVAIVVLATLVAALTFFNYWRRSNGARWRLALVGSLRGHQFQSISFPRAPPADVASASPMVALVKETGEPRDEDADAEAESSSDSGASENGAIGAAEAQAPLPKSPKVTFAAAEARDVPSSTSPSGPGATSAEASNYYSHHKV